MNDHDQNIIQKPCGQSGCCSLYPHLKQQKINAQSVLSNITIRNDLISPTQTNTVLSVNNSNSSPTSSVKRNQCRSMSKNNRRTRSRNSSSPHYSLLSKDEERLLEHVLDAYITHKGSQDLMAKSLAQKLNTNITKMEILCRTLCQLIDAKIQ